MTVESDTPSHEPQRRARVRPEHHRDYPTSYHGQWLRVVERHDPDVPLRTGYIWVEMAEGVQQVQGTHFDIAERSKRRILVVDDDPGIRKTLQIALSSAGYEVHQARDGDEATRLWHETGPDLIITDIHMPQRSGLLLIHDLQEQGSTIPIIAMTDGGPAGNRTLLGLAKLLGSVRTMPKPFSLDEMVKAVNEELSR